jgi:hypothetical protein
MTDDFTAVLDAAIAATGAERLRYLALEHPRPKVRRQYRELIERIAAGSTAVPVDYANGPPPARPCGSC